MKTAQQWQSITRGPPTVERIREIQVDVLRHVCQKLLNDGFDTPPVMEMREAWADKFDAEAIRIELGVDL